MTAPAKAAPMREDVTQADRENAVEILSDMWFNQHGNVTYGWMRDEESATLTGKRDTYWAVKACVRVRHRLAHTARPYAGDEDVERAFRAGFSDGYDNGFDSGRGASGSPDVESAWIMHKQGMIDDTFAGDV